MYWYVRIENKVKGPFPPKQVQQSVLLGRVDLNTPVSKDQQDWLPLRTFPELVPDALKGDNTDPQNRERLAAARRWADERRGERREADELERLGDGRRHPESLPVQEYREHREGVVAELKKTSDRNMIGLVIALVLLVIGAYAGFTLLPAAPPSADCTAAAAPGINWNHCQLPGVQILNQDFSQASMNSTNLQNANLFGGVFKGADLSYADLSQANLGYASLLNTKLKGANLRQSTLANASIDNADLSYANLTGANIENTSFNNVKLDNAIWIDGRTCATGSIDTCRPQNSSTE